MRNQRVDPHRNSSKLWRRIDMMAFIDPHFSQRKTGILKYQPNYERNCHGLTWIAVQFVLSVISTINSNEDFLMLKLEKITFQSDNSAQSFNKILDLYLNSILNTSQLIYYNLQMHISNHCLKNPPVMKLMNMTTNPNTNISKPDCSLLSNGWLMICPLKQPKLSSSILPIIKQTSPLCLSLLSIPQLMMQGTRGKMPLRKKAIKVTSPSRQASTSSSTNPSSANIMILTKASVLVVQSSVSLSASAWVYPRSRKIEIDSLISSPIICSHSQYSLSFSDLIQPCQLLSERQSPSPIPKQSPTFAASPIARILLGEVLEVIPEMMMTRMLMVPSNPPQTMDLMISPTDTCSSSCSWFQMERGVLAPCGGEGGWRGAGGEECAESCCLIDDQKDIKAQTSRCQTLNL